MSRRFSAAYDGVCDACGCTFDEGELIGYADDGDLVCPDCPIDITEEFDGPSTLTRPTRKPKPEPRQPFQGTSLDSMGY